MAVDLILDAVMAGAVAGASATATTAVTDAYGAVKDGIGRLLRRRSEDVTAENGADEGLGEASDVTLRETPEELLAAVEADPDADPAALREALIAADAGQDSELVAAARRVLELVDPDQVRSGKYNVAVHDSTGVQVGDSNTMTLNLGDHSPRR